MEFNVKNNVDIIMAAIKRVIQRKRNRIEGNETTFSICSEGDRSEKNIKGNKPRSTDSAISSEGVRSVQPNGWYQVAPKIFLGGEGSVTAQ